MTKVICLENYKGGVAKTTSAYNLAVAFWMLGKRVLLIDTDPQCNLSGMLGFNQQSGDPTLNEWLRTDGMAMPAYEKYPGLYYVPSSKALRDIESFLNSKVNREMFFYNKKLKPYLQPQQDGTYMFDYVLIDCSPKEGLMNNNNMSASDYVLIPAECSGFSLQGMQDLLFGINEIKENVNPKLDILGFLIIKYDKQTRISRAVSEFFDSNYGDKVFNTKIRKNVKFDETPLQYKGIFEHAPESNGAEDYMSLAEEITGCTRPENWQTMAMDAWAEANGEQEQEENEENQEQ
ncbi:ParA family protein [Bacteroides caecigallinarum]|uniref:ParA family protein n=1 Tax=Bacteroides caecigallinarum TaxID=1411144 RepID=UPI00195B06E8|nr:ParA family protein [Bacteroides caecigallinarum]MBM6866669.1 ParA family protein [Bacteroides caecigallinarum]